MSANNRDTVIEICAEIFFRIFYFFSGLLLFVANGWSVNINFLYLFTSLAFFFLLISPHLLTRHGKIFYLKILLIICIIVSLSHSIIVSSFEKSYKDIDIWIILILIANIYLMLKLKKDSG